MDERDYDEAAAKRVERLYRYDDPPGYDVEGREPCRICSLPIEYSISQRRYMHAPPAVPNDMEGVARLARFTMLTSTHAASDQ